MSDEFEETDTDQQRDAVARLLAYADELFQGELALTLGVDIERIEAINLGSYRQWRKPHVVKTLEGRDDYTVVLFALLLDKNPLEVVRDPLELDPGERYRIKPYRADLGQPYVTHLLHWSQLADVSVDDEAELARSGMPAGFAAALGAVSHETREVYQQNLRDIRDRPAALRRVKPKQFMRTIAAYGTYTNPAGDYFPKWQPGEEGSRDVVSAFTDEMLAHATSEVFLKAGGDYVLLTSPNGYRLFALAEDEHGALSAKELIGSYDSFHFQLLDTSRRTTAVLFHAAHGFPKTIIERRRRPAAGKRGAERLMLDPRRMVESLVGVDNATTLANLGDPWAWFVEMVKGFFPDPFYVLDFSNRNVVPHAQALSNVRQWSADAARAALASAADPSQHLLEVNAQRRRDIEAVLDDPTKIVIPQAARFGQSRVVGADAHWVYRRDLRNGALFAQTYDDFVWDAYLVTISEMIYENTAGVIPLVALVAACAAAPLVVTTVGPAAMARFVSQEAGKKAAGELAKRAAMRMVPALAAKMTSLVTSLFIYAEGEDDPQGGLHKWRAFADGFFRGYLVNTLYDSFYRGTIAKNLAEGIPEYRYYKLTRRVYRAIERVHHVVQTLEVELDRDAARRGIDHFKEAIGHTGRGVLLLMSALYHLDHDEVKAALDLFGAEPGHEPPNPAEWELEAGHQVAHIAEYLSNELQLHDLDQVLAQLRRDRTLPIAVTTALLAPHVWQTIAATWARRPFKWKKWEVKYIRPARPAIILVTLASMVGLLMYADDQLDDKLFTTLEDVLVGMVSDLPGPTADRARLNGEVVGNVLGVFMLNSFIHRSSSYGTRKKKWRDSSSLEKWDKLMNAPLLGSVAQSGLKIGKIGPILRLVFRRYVTLYEDLRAKGVFTRAQSEETIASFLNAVDDQRLEDENLARLEAFRTDTESTAFSLHRLVQVLFRLRTLLARDLEVALGRTAQEVLERAGIADDLAAFQQLARDSGLSAAVQKYGTIAYKTMALHLYAAVSELERALKDLMTPFTQRDKSWLALLRELGLDIEVDKAQALFDAEMKHLELLKVNGR